MKNAIRTITLLSLLIPACIPDTVYRNEELKGNEVVKAVIKVRDCLLPALKLKPKLKFKGERLSGLSFGGVALTKEQRTKIGECAGMIDEGAGTAGLNCQADLYPALNRDGDPIVKGEVSCEPGNQSECLLDSNEGCEDVRFWDS